MRIVLLPMVFLPLVAGCMPDPVLQALSDQDPPAVAGKVLDRRSRIMDAVDKQGGKIGVDLEVLGRPVISADLHGIHSAGAVLDALAPLTLVRSLDLYDTGFTDDDLLRVRGLPHLFRLNLASTAVTDAGLARLGPLPRLHDLFLNNTRIGDAGLQTVTTLWPGLTTLALCGTNVTDAGLAHLQGLKSLDKLTIGGYGLTNRGLAELKKVRRLRKLLIVSSPRITAAGVADLKESLPLLKVVR